MLDPVEPGYALVYVNEVVSQTVIARTLEKLGHTVATVSVEELGHIGPDISPTLLIAEVDLLESETDWVYVQRLKARFPGLRVLGLRHDPISRQRSIRLPCSFDGYLDKPLTAEAIKAVVEARVSESPPR